MKITDVNIDCLEKIFNFLDLGDILNVADSNKQLKQAAELAFKSKYGKYAVCIIDAKPCKNKQHRFKLKDNSISIECVTFCLKLLRCFGHLISKVKYSRWTVDSVHAAVIDRYINEYCAKFLTEIEFVGRLNQPIKELKPFVQAEVIHFIGCSLGSKLSELNKWFPKIRDLKLQNCAVPKQNGIVAHFPYLEHLTVNIYHPFSFPYGYTKITKEMVSEILRLNPTLRSLHIWGQTGIDAKYYQSISEYLQSLVSIEIDVGSNFFNLRDGTVHLKNVRKLKINYKSFDPISEITFAFDELEEITFECCISDGYSCKALSPAFFDFIGKQKSLKKLTLSCFTWRSGSRTFTLSDTDKFKLALPSLKEAELNGCVFTADEMVTFLSQCPLLRKFCFQFDHEEGKVCYNSRGGRSCNHLVIIQNRLGGEWRVSVDEKDFVELTR